VPVADESLGALGNEASDFFRNLRHRITSVTTEPRSFQLLMQRLGVAVQRGNAACVGNFSCFNRTGRTVLFITLNRCCYLFLCIVYIYLWMLFFLLTKMLHVIYDHGKSICYKQQYRLLVIRYSILRSCMKYLKYNSLFS